MLSIIISGGIQGVDGYVVNVEVDVCQGMPSFDIVGLPDSSVKESRERVQTAIKNCGVAFPVKRVTINLSPADTKKEGPYFDLPISVGILSCVGVFPPENAQDIFFAGELSLDGTVNPISGILPMVSRAKQHGVKKCVVPYSNGQEAALVEGMEIIGVKNLRELIDHLNGMPLKPVKLNRDRLTESSPPIDGLDFLDVRGQLIVKRALEISAAGRHNVIMIGPPGSGKTMMAKRIPGIMPDLTFTESLDTTKVYSVAGLLKDKSSLITKRPFRSPHHTISYSALTGGGRVPKPGEISLSHNGILFLDELPEFHRNVLEVLRQPLEEGHVTISRVNGTLTYPSSFMLVCSMNPCPCGYYGSSDKCTCSQNEIGKYLGKISGPLLDRIDIQVEAAAIKYDDLEAFGESESSAEIKKRVVKCLEIQRQRYENEGITVNSQLSPSQIEKYCPLGDEERALLKQAFNSLSMSARAYHKVLKVSRTIADLNGSERISIRHLAEAIQYRSLDRKYW